MGDKSSGAPAPDPRLIEAQIKSLGVQDDLMKRIVENSEAMLPLQKAQMEFGLDASKAAYQQSQEDRSWMLDRRESLGQMQDQLISDAKSFNEGARGDELAGRAVADVNAATSNQTQQMRRNMTRMGVNPNSGKFAAAANSSSLAAASMQAGAANGAREAARKEGYALTDRATNALAGYPAMGMSATGQGAGFGGMGLQLANQGAAGMNAGFGMASNIAGQSAQGYGNAWNQQNNAYQAGQAADASASAGLGQAVGTLGMLAFMSDPRLKEDVERVGKDEETGLNIYEFDYKGDKSDSRYQGVMADEVEKKYPEAVVETDSGFKAVNYGALGLRMKKVS